ncbi:hypothetical protein CA13_40170 [Planctomycetes bacterium CA13]|uniref:Uncharacterized protein n=2 Tax=Novipirellula herctigrandis TaxID=2527986 RepID=A0A5C5Z5N0_9BACT|nr:hypothetical protein CA13_40170 [Planctomycetes bacterium CA13]
MVKVATLLCSLFCVYAIAIHFAGMESIHTDVQLAVDSSAAPQHTGAIFLVRRLRTAIAAKGFGITIVEAIK